MLVSGRVRMEMWHLTKLQTKKKHAKGCVLLWKGFHIYKFPSYIVYTFLKGLSPIFWDILLMEEILHHLGCIKPCTLNNGIFTIPTCAGFLPSTVSFNSLNHSKSKYCRSLSKSIPSGQIRCQFLNLKVSGILGNTSLIVHHNFKVTHRRLLVVMKLAQKFHVMSKSTAWKSSWLISSTLPGYSALTAWIVGSDSFRKILL